MTADVPRRLPRTQPQRVQNVARTHAAQSLGGATAAARPVQNTTPTPTIYRKPVDTTLGTVLSGDSSGDLSVAIAGTTTGDGEAWATASESTAVGHASRAYADNSVAVGGGLVDPIATGGIAEGVGSVVNNPNGVAIGASAVVFGNRGVALGPGAQAVADQVTLGTTTHHVTVPGQLILSDGGGTFWRVTVTGGAIGLVAYP